MADPLRGTPRRKVIKGPMQFPPRSQYRNTWPLHALVSLQPLKRQETQIIQRTRACCLDYPMESSTPIQLKMHMPFTALIA
jgi:hypothetical protein